MNIWIYSYIHTINKNNFFGHLFVSISLYEYIRIFVCVNFLNDVHLCQNVHQNLWHLFLIGSCQRFKYSVFWYSWSRQFMANSWRHPQFHNFKNNICFQGVLLGQIDHPTQQGRGSKHILLTLPGQMRSISWMQYIVNTIYCERDILNNLEI